jgi:sugar phosphate isomerase/epimerase
LDGAEARIPALIREAAPSMFVATINGADRGASRKEIERVIQPLDKGTFDVGGVLKELRAAGFRGPIGLQCYKIQGEPREVLGRAMGAWRRYTAGQD